MGAGSLDDGTRSTSQKGRREPPSHQGVMLANHGALAFGASPAEAASANVVIEAAAILALNARTLGGANVIPSHMVEYTQQRRDQFAQAGTQGASAAESSAC